ncbi:hypothetical protein HMSSN036_78710 [Paenibacillus macerans]|nr:hypothetical protein HMSSN036_78710 [Paenibacillus macerans]
MAEDEAGEVIGEDLDLLRGQWTSILQEAGDAVAPALLHQDLSVVQRLMRDVYSPETDELIVDCPEQADEALAFAQMLPGESPRIIVYEGEPPLFEHYGVKPQLDKDFQRKVWLPGGGYLVWDTTEALTVIDVNTGKYIGGRRFGRHGVSDEFGGGSGNRPACPPAGHRRDHYHRFHRHGPR